MDEAQLQSQFCRKAEHLANRYDAENDTIPGAPAVTFTDFELLDICLVLNEKIKLLEERIERLEKETGHE